MTNTQNVVALDEHRKPPALKYCELRLRTANATRRLVMTAYTDAGTAVVLHWTLESMPPDFDLSLLDEAWAEWRAQSDEVVA